MPDGESVPHATSKCLPLGNLDANSPRESLVTDGSSFELLLGHRIDRPAIEFPVSLKIAGRKLCKLRIVSNSFLPIFLFKLPFLRRVQCQELWVFLYCVPEALDRVELGIEWAC